MITFTSRKYNVILQLIKYTLMRFFLLLSFNIFFIAAFAQQVNDKATGDFIITGKVVDSTAKTILEYATISLINDKTNKTVNGGITNSKGIFKIDKVAEGQYSISIEHIGYAISTKKITIEKGATNTILVEDILLTKKTNTLAAVVVTSSAKLIENKIDKIVFNVDKDITSQGGMAADALKKIPQVSIDINGNVELLGNPSIRFLINGKPSSIFGNSPAEALQSIPASQLQSIEVITSPSAKYDASGTGGIINFILKKSKVQGVTGNISLAAGTRLENASASLNVKKNNFGVNVFFNGNKQLVSNTPYTMNRLSTINGYGSSRFMQQSNPDFTRNGFKSGIGFDWVLSKKDNLSGSLGFNHFGNRTNGDYDQTFIKYDLAGATFSNTNSIRTADNKSYVNTFDNELSYKRKLGKDKHELEFTYAGSYAQNNTFYNQQQHYKNSNSPFAGSTSLNPGKENLSEFGINYAQPFGENILLETGGKIGIESIISSADVLTLNTANGKYEKDNQQTFKSDFRRNYYAAYVSMEFPLLKILDVKTGLRYERTDNNATYSNSGKASIPSYNNLAPSFMISHKFKNNQTLKFAYAYRLERPDFRDLNPFYNLADPHNITTGNPNLIPEIGNNFDLTYNKTFEKGANINITLFFQKNSPDIKPLIRYYPSYKIGDSTYTDLTLTTRANIAAEVKPGVNISVSIPFTKKLTIRSNIQSYNRKLQNVTDTPAVINAFAFRMNMNIAYQFTKQIAAEVFGNYNNGMVWQGKRPSAFSYTMAVRKQFKNGKGSIGVVAVNPFNQYINQATLQDAKNITTNIYQQLPYRSFGVSFTYKFGKIKVVKEKQGDNYLYAPPPGDN
jgi:ferric enterobactin receptor